MIVFVIVLAILVLSSARFAPEGQFQKDYISRDSTAVIKGIFVALILLSHGKGYIGMTGVLDLPYVKFQDHLNQMVVSMFFFYSGYGMMESIKAKRFSYVKSIATKRFPSVYLNFALALCCFLVMNAILGISHPLGTVLLSFTGWKSIGNSDWYMFAIFGLYLLTFVSFLPMAQYKSKKWDIVCLLLLTALSCGFVYMQIVLKRPMYCYDTVILFPLGFWYSYFKKPIEKWLMKNDILYYGTFAALLVLYLVSYRYRWKYGIEGFTVWATCFTLLTVLFTMKVSIESRFLRFLGDHVFSIYILQRIPLIVFKRLRLPAFDKYGYLVVCYVATFCLALLFDRLTAKLQGAIFKKKA